MGQDVARALCPLRDRDADPRSELPRSVRLLDIVADPLDVDAIRGRWRSSAGAVRCIVGIGIDGPFELDLERDGPHALIAGTTGAGKSELLQTLVIGFAMNARPADLQFVLIDYKGGAAFADCVRLPHTAGLVTDLDHHLTGRALRSLDAEIGRREVLFAIAGVSDRPGIAAMPTTGPILSGASC